MKILGITLIVLSIIFAIRAIVWVYTLPPPLVSHQNEMMSPSFFRDESQLRKTYKFDIEIYSVASAGCFIAGTVVLLTRTRVLRKKSM
jgi:hypothetical protein